MLADLQALKL